MPTNFLLNLTIGTTQLFTTNKNYFLSKIALDMKQKNITVMSGVVVWLMIMRTMHPRTHSKYFFFIIVIIFNRSLIEF